MQRGTIKMVQEKGFGFIAPEEGGDDVFFHATSLEGVEFNELAKGTMVVFDSEQGDKGLKATRVLLED